MIVAIYVSRKKKAQPVVAPPPVVKLGGTGRCRACVQKKLLACSVNNVAIQKWEADVAAGKVFSEIPKATRCEECRDNNLLCLLPRTAPLRKAIKRTREDSDVEILEPRKPKKSRVTKGSSSDPRHTAGLAWLPSLRKEIELLLNEQVKTTTVQARLADVLERLANKVVKDEPYVPPSSSSSEATESSASGDEDDLVKEVETLNEGDEVEMTPDAEMSDAAAAMQE